MKKRESLLFSLLMVLIVVLIIATPSILAVSNNTGGSANTANLSGFDKSYQCLKDKIDGAGYSSMNVEELSFSILALGYDKDRQDKLKVAIDAKKDADKNCWPTGSCALKQTALVFLAYNKINANTKNIQDWLMNQTGATNELIWYIQVENPSNELMQCTITYDGMAKKINVDADKIVSGSPGICFSIANNGYLLEVRNTCFNKDFEISCDKDFITTTPYQKRNDE